MNSISYETVKMIMRERELAALGHQRGAKSSASSVRSAARSLARRAHRTR